MTHGDMLWADSAPARQIDSELLLRCIEACFDCAQACAECADACLSDPAVADLTECIRSDLDCADMCEATGRLLSRFTGNDTNLTRAFLDTCAAACRACAEECERHASTHAHCAACVEACRRCEETCEALLAALA
jgi:hypothetical protein